jgi:hypothetical protein
MLLWQPETLVEWSIQGPFLENWASPLPTLMQMPSNRLFGVGSSATGYTIMAPMSRDVPWAEFSQKTIVLRCRVELKSTPADSKFVERVIEDPGMPFFQSCLSCEQVHWASMVNPFMVDMLDPRVCMMGLCHCACCRGCVLRHFKGKVPTGNIPCPNCYTQIAFNWENQIWLLSDELVPLCNEQLSNAHFIYQADGGVLERRL